MDYQLTFEDDPALVRLVNAWERAMGRLEPTMSQPQFVRFVKPLKPKGRQDNTIVVGAPGQFLVSWVKKNFQNRIEEALSDELGERVQIELLAEAKPKSTATVASIEASAIVAIPDEKFSDKFTFE